MRKIRGNWRNPRQFKSATMTIIIITIQEMRDGRHLLEVQDGEGKLSAGEEGQGPGWEPKSQN